MNLLFVDQFSEPGGAQQCLRDLMPAVVERSWNAHAALPQGGPLGQELLDRGAVAIHNLSLGSYTSGRKTLADLARFGMETPVMMRQIAAIVREHRIDCVYANGPRVLPASAIAAKNVVFHSHSLLSGMPMKVVGSRILRNGHVRVIASSRFVAGPLYPYVQPRIIYNGVADHQGPRLSNETFRVGIVGRIEQEKGQLDFVEAVRMLTPTMPDVEFVICGAPLFAGRAYAERVRDEARGLPIEFVEWLKDIGPLLRSLDILAVPSASIDATPRVIPEAYSAGVPVVVYPSGGLPEIVEDGHTGLIAPTPEPESLARRIRELYENPSLRMQLSQGARQAYQTRFSLARYRQEVLDFVAET